MEKNLSKQIVETTLQSSFDKERYVHFVRNLLKGLDESKAFHAHGYVKEQFKQLSGAIKTYERIGTYTDPEDKKLDVLIVYLEKKNSIDHARTTLRNFVADYLKRRDQKDAALVAFVSPNFDDWRFSLVKMDYRFEEGTNGKMKVKEEFTPARRWSFLVGVNENSHTAKSRLAPLVELENPLSLIQLEESFNIEKVTQEFFEKYRNLFLQLKENLDGLLSGDSKIKQDFAEKDIESVDFTKKLLGQIVFLYFLQKKGWFGVNRDENWGTGPKDFLRQLFQKKHGDYKNFFNEILEPLFYEALAKERDDNYYGRFNCKVPFLNGGLFDPIGGYDWVHTDIVLDNDVFSNNRKTKEGDIGDGILDIFDRYNFTVREDEPLEKEVAVDPEMLGKVFENLLEVKDRKSKGTYYTPREIVHYMCEQSLINYLTTELEGQIIKEDLEVFIKIGDQVLEKEALSSGKDNEDFILPESVRKNAHLIDEKLAEIKVCDPAIGSGAFPVGMMNEIVTARLSLNPHIGVAETGSIEYAGRTAYDFKLQAITNSLYGVDIDPGAVEIAKLRLWLSLIVDENDIKKIHPLPNLDYKIMQGNSLLEEFEGIRLFDENIIPQEKADIEAIKATAEKRISELSKEFIDLHATRKLSKTEELRIKDQIKAQQKFIKSLIDKPKPNTVIGLFDNHDEIKKKWDELTNLHKRIVNEYHKNEKEAMLRRASELEWEFIEATLRSEGRLDSISKIEQFKKKNTKPFFLWHLHFADVFQKKGGFDIMIANPPYVRQEEIGYKPDLKLEYEIFNSVSDLYTYFYENGFRLLTNSGVLTFITSNKFTRARYGVSLRRYLKEKTTLKIIINFGEKHIFDAITNTQIFIGIKQKADNPQFCYKENLEQNGILFFQNDLNDGEWTIGEATTIELKKKIENKGVSLSDWDINIDRGVVTGLNDAFVINETERSKIIGSDPCSESLIKPVIRGRDISRWCYATDRQYLISTFPALKIEIDSHEGIKDHLLNFGKEKLEQIGRILPNGEKSRKLTGNKWFETQDQIGYYNDFSKEKIIWIELTNRNKFAYSDHEDYILAGAFLMVGESLKYLLAFLNSKLCYFYFSLICNSSGMATIQWKKFALEKVPVPKLSEQEQKPFIEIVDKILDITKSSDYLENSGKQAQVKEYEHQVDQMVYELYGLTVEEIKIIEESV